MVGERLKSAVPSKTANLIFVVVEPVAKGSQKAYGIYMRPVDYAAAMALARRRVSTPIVPPSSHRTWPVSGAESLYRSIEASVFSEASVFIPSNLAHGRKLYVATLLKGTKIEPGAFVTGNSVKNALPLSKLKFVVIAAERGKGKKTYRHLYGVFATPQEYRRYSKRAGFDFAAFLRDTGKKISSVWAPRSVSSRPGTVVAGNRVGNTTNIVFNTSFTLAQARKGGPKPLRLTP